MSEDKSELVISASQICSFPIFAKKIEKLGKKNTVVSSNEVIAKELIWQTKQKLPKK